jgi:membrane associated rhomboid family serine protease
MERDSGDMNPDDDLPVWARENAFPPSREGYGWIDRKGVRHSCDSLEELSRKIREDQDSSIDLVWLPGSAHCRVPEEIEALTEPIFEIRKRWAREDLEKSKDRVKWLGLGATILIGYMALQAWMQLKGLERSNGLNMSLIDQAKWLFTVLSRSTSVGISLLVFLIFAFIPWYQAQTRQKELTKRGRNSKPLIPMIRFETWLHLQKAPITKIVLACISLAFVAQVIIDGSLLSFETTLQQAGLIKPAYRSGEYWRILTAPMLHGGILHFVMNALALLYLGKRMEVFARWPHVPAVFIFSALMAGETTSRLTDAASVGASGGLMGWLGFLLVFETLHTHLVPRSSRRMLLAAIFITALIGIIGYRFIDNAAHFGGLISGMIYAAIVFPKSSSVARPKSNLTDRIVGSASLAAVAFSAVLAILKMAG